MAARTPYLASARAVPPKILVSIIIALLAIGAAIGAIMLAGTKTGVALALFAVIGPLAIYGALTYPLVFPFTVFILLVPFDNILNFSAFGTLTRLAAIASGAAIAFWMLRTRKFIAPDKAVIAWTVFYVWCLMTLMWAIDPSYSMAHVFTLLQLLALYVAASLFPADKRSLAILVATVIASGAIASLYGIYLFRHGVGVSSNGRLWIMTDDSLIDPNQFAAALILPFALALMAVISARSAKVKVVAAVCMAAIAGGVAVAGSRGALVAVAAAFVYLLIRSRKRVALAAIGVGGLGLALGLYGNVLMRFGNAQSTGGAGRTDIWKVGISAFRDHPLFGAGFSNFPLAYDRAFLTISESYYTRWHRAPHDLLVQTIVEVGLVGAVLLGIALWRQFRILRIVPPDHPFYSLRLALEATMVGLLFASVFLDMMETKYLWLAFILVALARNTFITTTPQPNGRTT
jgi:O-antigen ligase